MILPGVFDRTGRWRGAARAFGAVLLGVLLGLTQPPDPLPVFFLAIPALYGQFIRLDRSRSAAIHGWMLGAGYFTPVLSWIREPFQVEAETYGWMADGAVLLTAAGLSLFWAIGFWLAFCLRRMGLHAVIALSGAWALAELARGTVLTGFPWVPPALGWIDHPIGQVVSLIGMYGLNFATFLAGCLMGQALVRTGARRGRCLLLVLFMITGAWVWGHVHQERTRDDIAPMAGKRIRIVQPSIAQREKWKPERRREFAHTLLALSDGSRTAPEDAKPDILVWPEAAAPWPLGNAAALRARIGEKIAPGGVALIGSLHAVRHTRGVAIRNSLFALDSTGAIIDRYDKHHLTPFGEYLPFRAFFSALGLKAIAARGDMEAGEGPRTLRLGGLPPFAPLICYEAIFPHAIGDGVTRPQWLLQITNDAWFGVHAGPEQHLALARLRAIERGVSLVRVGNNGISAIIDPFGRIAERLPFNRVTAATFHIPSPLPPTPYEERGEITWLAAFVLASAVLFFFSFARRARPRGVRNGDRKK